MATTPFSRRFKKVHILTLIAEISPPAASKFIVLYSYRGTKTHTPSVDIDIATYSVNVDF